MLSGWVTTLRCTTWFCPIPIRRTETSTPLREKPAYYTSSSYLPKSATYLRDDNAEALQYTITNLDEGDVGVGDVTYQW